MTASVAARFWAKVGRSGGPDACWRWTGAHNKYGYGHFRMNGRVERAHRVAVALGDPPGYVRKPPAGPREIPDKMYVLHTCDVRDCVNPAHLKVGSPSENLKDEYARYRRPAMPLAAIRANAARRATSRE